LDNQGSELQPSGRRIALGLADHLDPFAERIVAETWRLFAAQDLLNWRFTFLEFMDVIHLVPQDGG
jgi:hypothetical protein